MQLILLHLDDSLKQQPVFLEMCRSLGVSEIEASLEGARLRLWADEKSLRQFGQRLLEPVQNLFRRRERKAKTTI
jgi:hypothetical protein